jgi:hypothetical protein
LEISFLGILRAEIFAIFGVLDRSLLVFSNETSDFVLLPRGTMLTNDSTQIAGQLIVGLAAKGRQADA